MKYLCGFMAGLILVSGVTYAQWDDLHQQQEEQYQQRQWMLQQQQQQQQEYWHQQELQRHPC
jgi:hypothetical protein